MIFFIFYNSDILVMDKLREMYLKKIDIDTKIKDGFDYIKAYFKKVDRRNK